MIFGGDGNGKIMMLDLKGLNQWVQIDAPLIFQRRFPFVCVESAKEVMIAAGFNSGYKKGTKTDILLFDFKKKSTRKVAEVPFSFDNGQNNQVFYERPGTVVALVR